MENNVVTGCTASHIPGVIALYNSLKKNTDMNFDFHVLCTGGRPDDLEWSDLTSQMSGFSLMWDVELDYNPGGSGWGDGTTNSSMYNRVLIPNTFSEYKRSIWLDSDTIVLDNISRLFEMDMESNSVAMSLNGNPWNREKQCLKRDMDVWNYDFDISDIDSPQAGVMMFDNKRWLANEMTAKFIEATKNQNIKGKFVVQSYLGYILMGKFLKLNFEWNVDVSWLDMAQGRGMLGDPHILHYIGGGKKLPWDPQRNNYTFAGKDYTKLWEEYYNDGEII